MLSGRLGDGSARRRAANVLFSLSISVVLITGVAGCGAPPRLPEGIVSSGKITTSNPHFSPAWEKPSPLFPSSLSGQLACCCRPRGHSMGRQLLLPRCYQNTPYQEHPGAPSVSPNCLFLVRIGPLGCAQFGPRTDYESVGQTVPEIVPTTPRVPHAIPLHPR